MSASENKELLLRVVTRFVAMQMKEHDELMPFGATLNSGRKIELLMPKSMKQSVTIEELSTYWSGELRAAAQKSGSPTVCSCCAGLFRQQSGTVAPSVFIHIEHAGVYSEDILFPYKKEIDGSISFGERESESVDHEVFPIN